MKNIIRWVLVIPVSFVSLILGYVICLLVFWLFSKIGLIDHSGGDDIDATTPSWAFFIISNFFGWSGAVGLGALTAPTKKTTVAVIISLIGVGIFTSFYIYINQNPIEGYEIKTFWAVLSCIGALLGMTAAIFNIRQIENEE